MKKILALIITGSLLFTMSCTDWLKEEQFDKINVDVLYSTEAGLNAALNGLFSLNRRYYRFTDTPDTRANYWFYCADDISVTRTYNEANIYQEGMIAGNFYADMWINGYQLIDRSSAIIVNAQSLDISAAVKNKIVAQAKVVRAMTYLRLITIYDRILLDTIPTTAANAFDKVEYKPATKEEIHGLINSDLDFAIANLPYNSAVKEVVNQAIARQLRAESAMWTGDYATAAANCDAIIDNGGYTLPSIDQVFITDPAVNSEVLMVLPFDELLGGNDSIAGGSGSPLGAAFQSRYYEIQIVGQPNPIIEDNKYGGNAFGWNLPNNYLRSLYESSDKRLKYYYYPDTLIANNPLSPIFGKPLPGPLPYSPTYRQYHWSIMKYRDLEKPAGANLSYRDKIMYRLSETLLLGAEAHWRIGGNSDTKALDYLNRVRVRAGLAKATTIDLDVIMDENARELGFEGKRWFFLKRIGRLVTQVNLYHKFGSSTTNEVSKAPMDDHQTRWPIPQSQLDIMGPSFPNNPGY